MTRQIELLKKIAGVAPYVGDPHGYAPGVEAQAARDLVAAGHIAVVDGYVFLTDAGRALCEPLGLLSGDCE